MTRAVLLLAAVAIAASLIAVAHGAVEQAQSAEVFADSVCVNTHFGYLDSAWGTDRNRLIQLIADAGIRNIRDDNIDVGLLLAAKGIKMNYGWAELDWFTDSDIDTTRQFVAELKQIINSGFLIDAILNVNEPDLMWEPKGITYNGKGFPEGPLDYMRDLHTLLRADPFFNDKWIVASPMGNAGVLPANCCSEWIDFADMHPYPFDGNYLAATWETYDTIYRYFYFSNQPSVNLAEPYPQAWEKPKTYYPDKPWFVTETGYPTETGQTSIRSQGLYTNRIFTEYFRLGIRRTCVYELLNNLDDPDDHESNFGILFANYTAKPAYTALKNLMALVRSDWSPSASQLRPPTYALKSLDFSLSVSAVGSYDRIDYVHHLLLQKPNGTLLLLVWHEISTEDADSRRQIYPPRMPTLLTLPAQYNVRVYAPNDGPGLSTSYTADAKSTYSSTSSVSLLVPEHVIVVQLDAVSASPTRTPTPSRSATPTRTPSPSRTPSSSLTPSGSATPTRSPTPSRSPSSSPTRTPSPSISVTPSRSPAASTTPSATRQATPSASSAAASPSRSPTVSSTRSATPLPIPSPTGVRAQSAEVFADSVCVNTHFGYQGTAWVSDQTRLIQMIADAGIRNVRDEADQATGLQLAAKGIKLNFGRSELPYDSDSNIETTRQIVAEIKAAINSGFLADAILSANAPDNMWYQKGITYNGQGFPEGAIEFMRDFYTLIRADPFFDDKWVIGSPLANVAQLPANCCSQWVDYGDMHPYGFDGNYLAATWETYDTIYRYFYFSNQPSVNLAEPYPQAWDNAKAYYPNRPWFATETGYPTSTDASSIRAQALYMNRIFTEYFRLGIRRTCVYAFLDDRNAPDDRDANFGLVFANYTAKPSYTALKNLMALVRSDWAPSAAQVKPPTFTLKSLDFSLSVSAVGSYDRTDYVHHLLLQKPNGTLLLLVWHEISAEDVSTGRQIFPPRMPAILSLPPQYNVRVYAPNDGPGLSTNYTADGKSTYSLVPSISLLVPDHVIVLQLEQASPSPSPSVSASPTRSPTPSRSATPSRSPTSSPSRTPTSSPSPSPTGVQAQSAEVFADSVCVNTHFGYQGTAWVSDQTRLVQMIADAGIRNVRDEADQATGLQLAAKGIKLNFGRSELPYDADSNIETTRQIVAEIKAAINSGFLADAILSANAPDNMWYQKGITYNGQGFPEGAIEFMRDFYTLIRADSFFNDRWVIGSPLANVAQLPANCCSQWVDYGDMHPYGFDGNYLAATWETYDTIYRYFYFSNQPSVNLAEPYPQAWDNAKAYYPNRPWFATETGYPTSTDASSIRAQALYMNRIFTEYFRLGIRRTCVYAFLDDRNAPDDRDANFGLVFSNYTAKPSYTALKNLMALVRSDWAPSTSQLRPPTYALKRLDFHLDVSAVGSYDRTDYVHHLLLQKPNGTLLLLVWHEISAEDVSSGRQIYPPRMPAVLTLPLAPQYNVRVYAPNDGPGLSTSYTADAKSTYSKASSISLLVPDHVIVLQLDQIA